MKNNDKKKPFFASFLEKQIQNPEEIQGGGGGIITGTLDDSVTVPTKDTVVSTKILDNPTTTPAADTPVTLKYPSDSDEGGFTPVIPGIDPYEP